MKNALLFTIAFFAIATAFSQKPYKEKASFDYIRLALQPLPSDIKNYKGEVILTYKEKVNGERDARQAQIDAANEKNAKARKEYDDKSFGEKLGNKALLGTKGPTIVDVPVHENYYPIIHNESSVAGTYLKINGYGSAPDNSLKITAYLDGFQYTTEEKMANKSVKKDGATVVVNTFAYLVRYKHPIKLIIETEAAGVIYEGYVEATNREMTAKTKYYHSREELQNYWTAGQNGFLGPLDTRISKLCMEATNDELNSLYGVSKITREISVWLVKGKKYDYADYQSAYEYAVMGYGKLDEEGSNAKAFEYIKKGIDGWEAALKESEPKNKKARVNNKVTAVTRLNLAEAYIWINDFSNAELQLDKTRFLDLNKFTKLAAKQKELVDDQKARFEANK